MKVKATIFIYFTILMFVFAQKGDLYITHFTAEDEQIENENFSITQDHNGQIFAANRRGILKFDGKKWDLIKTPTSALAIQSDVLGKLLYIGCLDGFGYINSDQQGNEQYVPILYSKEKYLSISKVIVLRKFVYFLGDGIIYKYSKSEKKVVQQFANSNELSIDNIFEYLDDVFISDKQRGLFRIENTKIEKIRLAFPEGEKVVCAIKANDNSTLLFTDKNQVYSYNGYRLNPFKLEDEKYLKESVVNDGLALDKNLAALATNRGGCLIFNVNTGKTLSIANYFSGLPDNEIFAIGKDAQNGVWISHEFGFSRLDFQLPLRTYSNYLGLEGHLESAVTYKGKLYVATSEGVYYLTETQNTSVIVQYINKTIKKNESNAEEREGKTNEKIDDQKNKVEKIKRFLGIFKRRKKEPEPEQKADDKTIENTKKMVKNNTDNKVKVVKKVVTNPGIGSIKYYFKKIANIDSKCSQLIVWGNNLLVASNNGIYIIENEKASKINSSPISYLYLSRDKSKVLAGTRDSKLLCFNTKNNTLIANNTFESFNDDVVNICESQNNIIWVSTDYYVYKFELDNNGQIAKKDTYFIQNPYSDDINIVYYEDKLLAITSSDIYKYEPKLNQMIKDNSSINSKGKYFRLVHSENNKLWVNSSQKWELYTSPKLGDLNLSFLNLMPDIQEINIDNTNQNCWVITKKGLLCQVNPHSNLSTVNGSSLFLNYIESESGRSNNTENILIQEHKSSIAFNFIIPEYLDGKENQFSYLLKNLNNKEGAWSSWDKNNMISFNHLQSADYELTIRSKNTLGQITYSHPIYFTVKPPYWQTWWFYLLEISFFTLLLILSVVFNRIGGESKTVSKVLTFITIIIFVELITTIVESFIQVDSTPVISFATKVIIAITIFPVEQLMYKFIIKKSKDTA